jgi:hypothetical protein
MGDDPVLVMVLRNFRLSPITGVTGLFGSDVRQSETGVWDAAEIDADSSIKAVTVNNFFNILMINLPY